jgi:5-methylcytosine-specific restriction endonuclease McrA
MMRSYDYKKSLLAGAIVRGDLKCGICGRPFKTKSGQENHIKNYHRMDMNEYEEHIYSEAHGND